MCRKPGRAGGQHVSRGLAIQGRSYRGVTMSYGSRQGRQKVYCCSQGLALSDRALVGAKEVHAHSLHHLALYTFPAVTAGLRDI